MTGSFARRIAAEAIGTAFLLATVIGSGIMAERLAGGNQALALLCNTLPTGAILVVLILVFGPVSGAHFNPAVTIAETIDRRFRLAAVAPYLIAQIAGGLFGMLAAHAMFDMTLLQVATHTRSGTGQWLAEAIATFGLIITIDGCRAKHAGATPYAVGLYITAAYWFTASTSFANPAVTIARAFTDTFSGIAPHDAPAFIVAQLIGMTAAVGMRRLIWPPHAPLLNADCNEA